MATVHCFLLMVFLCSPCTPIMGSHMPILISHHNACGTFAKHAPRFCNLAHCATAAAAGFRQQVYHSVDFHCYFNWYSTTEAQRCTDIQREMLILLIKCCASVSFQFWLPLFLYQRLCGAIVWGATPIIQGNTATASRALMAGINKSNCVTISQQQAKQLLRRVYLNTLSIEADFFLVLIFCLCPSHYW